MVWVLRHVGWGAMVVLAALQAAWLCYHVAGRSRLSAAADVSADAACLPQVARHHVVATAVDRPADGIAADPRSWRRCCGSRTMARRWFEARGPEGEM